MKNVELNLKNLEEFLISSGCSATAISKIARNFKVTTNFARDFMRENFNAKEIDILEFLQLKPDNNFSISAIKKRLKTPSKDIEIMLESLERKKLASRHRAGKFYCWSAYRDNLKNSGLIIAAPRTAKPWKDYVQPPAMNERLDLNRKSAICLSSHVQAQSIYRIEK